MDKDKKPKITKVEIFIILVVIILFGIYLYPNFALSIEQKRYGRMQTNAAMLTSKILASFSDNTIEHIPSKITKEIIEEMNKLCKNPVDKKNPAYSFEQCKGCVVIETDDTKQTVVLTAKDDDDKLILRTIIQPPSFITYTKDFKEK